MVEELRRNYLVIIERKRRNSQCMKQDRYLSV
jgi:hypothetical protein